MLGDVNGDKILDARDATAILTEYAHTSTVDGKSIFNDDQKKAADVNKDGILDARDATAVFSFYVYTSVPEHKDVDFDTFMKL